MVVFLFNVIWKTPSKHFRGATRLQMISAIFNGVLGLVYLILGIWMLVDKLRLSRSVSPLHWWLLVLFQELTWLPMGLMISLRGRHFPKASLRVLSILALLFTAIACCLSLITAIFIKEVSIKIALDILSFLGASLLLLCTYIGYKYEEIDENLCPPLNSEVNGSSITESVVTITPFAKARFFNKMTFWWLNPLMKRGGRKHLRMKIYPNCARKIKHKLVTCYSQKNSMSKNSSTHHPNHRFCGQ
ncbi:hypothetical protein CsSME_00029290 [Camellia sinensis var. sinensis]